MSCADMRVPLWPLAAERLTLTHAALTPRPCGGARETSDTGPRDTDPRLVAGAGRAAGDA